MKKSILTLVVLLAVSNGVKATTNTLDLVDSYRNGSDTVCVYSDGDRTEVYTKSGAGSCPSKKTFH